MTNAELIAKIKAEIERRIKIQDDWAGRKVLPGRDLAFAVKEELKQLLSFLDTLESEKPIDPEAAMKELDEKIALVKQRGTWDGVDVDKYMDEVRGREPEKTVPADLEEAAEDFVWEVMENDEDGISDLCRKLQYTSKISDFYDALAEFFVAGAKWQAKRMKDEKEKE